MKLIPPTSYQGGKQRIAKQILDIINPKHDQVFMDYCCGSGGISFELISRGFPANQIHMIDRGPYGLIWELVGKGKFNLPLFKQYCDAVPKQLDQIQDYIKELSKQDASIATPYVYLLLQASSFGGKAIWIKSKNDGYSWENCSFKSYWLPTATSNRKSHVNPMGPMPDTLYSRMELICEKFLGVNGHFCSVLDVKPEANSIVYVDPPYSNTTLYGYEFNLNDFVTHVGQKLYISEGKPLSENCHLIVSSMAKGGISGERKKDNQHEEWLSIIGN